MRIAAWQAVVMALSSLLTQVNPPLPAGEARVVAELCGRFEAASAVNAQDASRRTRAIVGGEVFDAIYLHPGSTKEDALLRFPPIKLPAIQPHTKLCLVLQYGLQDEVQWEDPKNPPNGVRFGIIVNDERVLDETVANSGMRARSISLDAWASQEITISLAVNAIDGNPSYDWALFGEPTVLEISPQPLDALGEKARGNGFAFATIESHGPSRYELRNKHKIFPITTGPGKITVPVPFVGAEPSELHMVRGEAALLEETFVIFPPRIGIAAILLDPPKPMLGETFDLHMLFINEGAGYAFERPTLEWGGALTRAPEGWPSQEPFFVAPNEKLRIAWRNMQATTSPWLANVKLDGREIALPFEPRKPIEVVTEKTPFTPVDGTPWRFRMPAKDRKTALSFEVVGNDLMLLLETATADRWETLGFMNLLKPSGVDRPLPNVDGKTPHGALNTDSLQVLEIRRADAVIVVDALLYGFPARLELTPDRTDSRWHVRLIGSEVLQEHFGSFKPSMAYFCNGQISLTRDFALFPGLEFLEGDEGSSSERDLAPPLNKRDFPQAFKQTAPFAAAQFSSTGDPLLAGIITSPAYLPPADQPAMTFTAEPRHESPVQSVFGLGKNIVCPKADGAESTCVEFTIVLDTKSRFDEAHQKEDTSRAAFLLDMYRHYVEVFGLPAPSPQPRAWEVQKALCAGAYLDAVGSADPPGFRHCAGWEVDAYAALAVPIRLLLRDGLESAQASELNARIATVVQRALKESGGAALASSAGAHIVNGETPFFEGHVGESLRTLREHAFQTLNAREDGVWKWHPATPKHALLGKAGDHTLGQAAYALRGVMRAARLSGHLGLRQQALDALKTLKQYAVPRGAQTWECPLYQPDILAAAHAISAYMDAYHITGDPAHLRQAVYWAKTGLPFVYLWSPSGHPAMLYNTIPVFGSTWFTHSWIGLPVVWCGLVYAYALQDLAPYDQSFDWRTIAQGITNSAMHQQYTDGPSKGCYPDSWNVLESKPIPADINPENIVLNECRLRGNSAALRTVRVPGRVGEALINSIFDLPAVLGGVGEGKLGLVLRGRPGFPGYTAIAPAQAPKEVQGAGAQAADSAALAALPAGWLYDREAQALILKHTPSTDEWKTEILW